MGIQDLYNIIRKHAKSQILTYHFSELSGLRFAVDISIFLYKYTRTTGSNAWMNQFILLLSTLKSHGIKAVCIFDGPNPPPEKKEEQDRRRAETQKAVERMEKCIKMRKNLQKNYLPFDDVPSSEMIEECRKLIGVRKGYPETTDYSCPQDICDSLTEVIERLRKSTYTITPEDKDNAAKIVKMMGLAAIQADGEAETLCAYLAVKGLVDAVLTEDTDVLAYGTPLMLSFKDYKLHEKKLQGIYLPGLLEELELDTDEFRDLCILLSCDYNKRVKGFPPDGKKYKKPVPIGEKHAYTMIQEYRRFEQLLDYIEDAAPLKYKRCRELFTIPKNVPQGLVPYNRPLDYKALQKLVNDNRLTVKIPYIEKCYQAPTLTFHDSSSDAPENEEFADGDLDDALAEDEQDISSEDEVDEEIITTKIPKISFSDSPSRSDEPYCVILCGDCRNDKTGKVKNLDAHFKFESEELYGIYEGDGFDMLLEGFNEWLHANGHKGWYIDDVVETYKTISPEDAIMPYVVTE